MTESSHEKIIDHILKDESINKIKLAVTDIDGVLRGKYIHKSKFESIIKGGFSFCDVIFGWDSADLCYDNSKVTGWHTGYPDAKVALDFSTYRQVPWDNNVPFFLGHFEDELGNRLDVCPRNLLRTQIDKANKNGYRPIFAQEFEWFNFSEETEDLNQRSFTSPQPITPGMFGYSLLRASKNSDFFNSIFDQMDQYNVPLEGLHTETGPGVYEAAIIYTDALEAADRAVLFKSGVKEIGHDFGIMPSFMAKWNEKLPGCSGHIHQSIWDLEQKKNLFYSPQENEKLSRFMESYIAGVLHCLPEVLPMYAPTINSYKRLVEGAWAPTNLTWGHDNRTTAIRVLPGSSKSTRIELRVPGSDCNPYLSMAATLASGMYGVENQLKLNTPPVSGNGYKVEGSMQLPSTLEHAAEKMKNSEVAMHLFGETFVDHFIRTREWEVKEARKAVTDWELKRYFEII